MHQLKPLARKLRKEQTDTERLLWRHIRNNQIAGVKFRRQVPMGNYIADFVSIGEKLIIEIDGGQHNEEDAIKYDAERTKYFEELGFRVIRFWNNEVTENLEGVLEKIYNTIMNPTSS